MGKQRKKKPADKTRPERAEGFAGYLLTLKRRPGLQDLTGIKQTVITNQEGKDEDHSYCQKQK